MTEKTIHISINIDGKIKRTIDGFVFKERVTDSTFSRKKFFEEAAINFLATTARLSEEEKKLLKEQLNIE